MLYIYIIGLFVSSFFSSKWQSASGPCSMWWRRRHTARTNTSDCSRSLVGGLTTPGTCFPPTREGILMNAVCIMYWPLILVIHRTVSLSLSVSLLARWSAGGTNLFGHSIDDVTPPVYEGWTVAEPWHYESTSVRLTVWPCNGNAIVLLLSPIDMIPIIIIIMYYVLLGRPPGLELCGGL